MKRTREKEGVVNVPVNGQATSGGSPIDSPKLDLEKIIESPNLTPLCHEAWLMDLGKRVIDELIDDETSRVDWDTRMNEAIKVVRQIVEQKSFPWPGAANIRFPLITIAALQWHARAYALLMPPGEIVEYRTYGPDPEGKKNKRGKLISEHMTWQLEEEDETWEDNQDKALLVTAIMGDAFKKSYFDPLHLKNVSRLVMPQDLVVDYWTKSFETALRISHKIQLTKNDVWEREAIGIFNDTEVPYSSPSLTTSPNTDTKNQTQGTRPPMADRSAPDEYVEQHRWEDMDGDGYKEPYVVTVHRQSKIVKRIVARFTSKRVVLKNRQTLLEWKNDPANDRKKLPGVMRIEPVHCFTKYPFIPAFDGGFYDVGFGLLLGHINEAVSTLINQLLDSGTMSNTSGGFLGRGIKIRGGTMYFKPNEWKQVDSPGAELKNNIVPLPVREPSNVLFQLLNLLINYGERTAGATDIQVGQTPGQNTPASTSQMAEANGLRVFGAIFKRTYRAMRDEFRKLYVLNGIYLDDMPENPFMATTEDYSDDERSVRPSADPHVMSDQVRMQRAEALLKASTVPGVSFDQYQTRKRYLEAWQIPNIEQVMPDPKGPNAIPQPPNPKMLEVQVKMQQVKLKEMQLQTDMKFRIAQLLQDMDLNSAKIVELEAKASLEAAKGDAAKLGQVVEMLNVELGARKLKQDGMLESVKILHEIAKGMRETTNAAGVDEGNVGPVDKAPGDAGGSAVSALTAGAGDGGLA